ncbi:MAG: hypothetical protein WC797_00030 [Candidatus Paceibacterota bacterium]|jgi:dCTP deaminase
MILSGKLIAKLIKNGKIKIGPNPEIKEASVKIHFGGRFGETRETLSVVDNYILEPKHFVLAESREDVALPENLAGLYDTYVGLARQGITTHMGSMLVDPGFCGKIQLEIFNCSDVAVELKEGMRAGHLMIVEVLT